MGPPKPPPKETKPSSGKGAASNKAGIEKFLKVYRTTPPVCSKNYTYGQAQRLRIEVPTHNSVLSMGHADTKRGTYEGFGITTKGHIFCHADGQTKFESLGHMILQSVSDSVYIGSAADAVLGSSSGLLMTGKSGVVINGGGALGADPPKGDEKDSETPSAPDQSNGAAGACRFLGTFWSSVDGGLAAFCAGMNYVSAGSGGTDSKKATRKYIVSQIGFMSAAACAAFNFSGVFNSSSNIGSIGGTVIHGSGGVLCGSPLFTSIFAGSGVAIGSGIGAFVSGRIGVLFGGASVSLSSMNIASVVSNKQCQVTAKKQVLVYAKDGTTTVSGYSIGIGGKVHAVQTPTSSIGISTKDLILNGNSHVGVSCSTSESTTLGGKSAAFCALEDFVISSDKKVSLAVSNSRAVLSGSQTALVIGEPVPKPPPGPQYGVAATKSKKALAFDSEKANEYLQELRKHARKCANIKQNWTQIKFTNSGVLIQVKKARAIERDGEWSFNGKVFKSKS